MNVRRKAYEEHDARLNGLKGAWDGPSDARKNSPAPRTVKAYLGGTTGSTTDNRVKSLAEAVILQSIEDLWNPISKRDSLKFFEGSGFALYSRIAGIRYIKQLAVLRMLADAGKRNP